MMSTVNIVTAMEDHDVSMADDPDLERVMAFFNNHFAVDPRRVLEEVAKTFRMMNDKDGVVSSRDVTISEHLLKCASTGITSISQELLEALLECEKFLPVIKIQRLIVDWLHECELMQNAGWELIIRTPAAKLLSNISEFTDGLVLGNWQKRLAAFTHLSKMCNGFVDDQLLSLAVSMPFVLEDDDKKFEKVVAQSFKILELNLDQNLKARFFECLRDELDLGMTEKLTKSSMFSSLSPEWQRSLITGTLSRVLDVDKNHRFCNPDDTWTLVHEFCRGEPRKLSFLLDYLKSPLVLSAVSHVIYDKMAQANQLEPKVSKEFVDVIVNHIVCNVSNLVNLSTIEERSAAKLLLLDLIQYTSSHDVCMDLALCWATLCTEEDPALHYVTTNLLKTWNEEHKAADRYPPVESLRLFIDRMLGDSSYGGPNFYSKIEQLLGKYQGKKARPRTRIAKKDLITSIFWVKSRRTLVPSPLLNLRLDIIGNVKLVEVKMTKASAEEERAPEEEEDEAEMASAVDQEGVPEADISPEEAPQEVQGAERTPGDQDVAQEILKAPETVEPAHSISIQQPTVELETFASLPLELRSWRCSPDVIDLDKEDVPEDNISVPLDFYNEEQQVDATVGELTNFLARTALSRLPREVGFLADPSALVDAVVQETDPPKHATNYLSALLCPRKQSKYSGYKRSVRFIEDAAVDKIPSKRQQLEPVAGFNPSNIPLLEVETNDLSMDQHEWNVGLFEDLVDDRPLEEFLNRANLEAIVGVVPDLVATNNDHLEDFMEVEQPTLRRYQNRKRKKTALKIVEVVAPLNVGTPGIADLPGISEPMDVSLEPPAAELLVVAAPSQQKKTRAPRRRREKVAAPTRPALESRKAKVDARVLITHIFNDRNASIPRESAKRAKLVEALKSPAKTRRQAATDAADKIKAMFTSKRRTRRR